MESQPQNPELRNYPENFHPHVKSLVRLKILDLICKLDNISKDFPTFF